MKKAIFRKGMVLAIIGLFVGSYIIPSTATIAEEKTILPTFNGKTLYVGGSGPNNYTKIQDAINDSSFGDTVFVFDDSSPYVENLVVDKSIHLIGENKDTTVIDGGKKEDVVHIIVDLVNIHGFTIQNILYGSYLDAGISINSDCCIVTDNIIYNTGYYGLIVDHSDNCYVSGNTISGNEHGVTIADSYQIIVEDNIVQENRYTGIGVYRNHGVTKILNNSIVNNNRDGIYIFNMLESIEIKGNVISENEIGILNHAGSQRLTDICIISENVISSNKGYGMMIFESERNLIYKNNFENNGVNVDMEYYWRVGFGINKWHFLLKGNYWDDGVGSGPKIILGKMFLTGGRDEDKSIPWINIDWFPAREPYDIP